MALGLVAALGVGFTSGTQVSSARVDAGPPAVPVTAKETCGQISDIYTLLLNAWNSFAESRSTEQEYQGASWLAARMLDRVDAAEGTVLAKRLDALKSLVPSSRSGTQWKAFDPMSTEWNKAFVGATAACKSAGAEVGVESWTGG